ncbi:hypothetical protein GLX30_09545 [Streptomyces sp. Tu 2975]|uniref:terpene synthase family protein n=1 Tax=Streptomyces sp. Tu 2975 TaxID=2676871 RepID=UPI00135C1690|nr:hypothetical protein [Streptomyces sp. Tu 2975]QIP84232.1 hypothetical protein GLX30_09545 [Streptomyces sp. Tu 2975]
MNLADLPEGFWTFYCPLDEETGADAERLSANSAAWAQKFDLGLGDANLASLYGAGGASLITHAFPHATTDPDLAQALADYSAWAFMTDDFIVPDPNARADILHTVYRWAHTMQVPRSWESQGTHLDDALRNVLERLRACMSDVQYERFTTAQAGWLHAMLWERALRERGTALTVNDYLAVRIGAVGVHATLGYLDAVEGTEITAQEWSSPPVKAAVEASLFAAALDNDRYSFCKESDLAQVNYNLFGALQHEHPDWTLAQAMIEGIAIRDTMLALYLRLREQILPTASPDLRKYLTGVERVVSGDITFGTTCMRYFAPEAAPHIQRTFTPPAHLSDEPLPYPTIAWWWEHITP